MLYYAINHAGPLAGHIDGRVHAAGADLHRSAIASLKAQIGRAARYVGSQAVQLHGGMGVSEELDIGHHYIRLNMIDRLFGDRDFHLSRYADLTQGTTA